MESIAMQVYKYYRQNVNFLILLGRRHFTFLVQMVIDMGASKNIRYGSPWQPSFESAGILGRTATPLNVHAPAPLLQAGFASNAGVVTACIDISTGIAQVEQLLEDGSIGRGSM